MVQLCSSLSRICVQRHLLSLSSRTLAEGRGSTDSGVPRDASDVTNLIVSRSPGEDGLNVLKVIQRFQKRPHEWPMDEQPFAIVQRKFLGRVMHPVELRPERGFVNMVPFGFMLLRHFFRKVRAKGNYELFKSTGIFDDAQLRAGTTKVFEIISQHACKNKLLDLVTKKFCGADVIQKFEAASSSMSGKQRELLNLTEKDVYAIAPGVLGPFQLIQPMLRDGIPHITYSLLCCAFYKKQMLFDAVKDLPLLERGEKAEYLPMPIDYGNRAPLRTQNRYPPDQRAFSLTRDATETTSKYQNGLCFKEENNVVLTEFKNVDLWTKTRAYVSWLKTKLFVLGAEPCLTMSSDDLIQGGRKVFRIILDAVVRKNIDSLTPLVLRSAVLDVHRKRALELKEKQRNALSVTDADLVGMDGFVHNWDGFGSERGSLARLMHSASIVPRDATGSTLDVSYFKYSIILMALLRKNELYKMVRQLPFNLEGERLLLRMPHDYGFITPRYVIMRIDMCHQVISPAPMALHEEGLIYDFHIHSF